MKTIGTRSEEPDAPSFREIVSKAFNWVWYWITEGWYWVLECPSKRVPMVLGWILLVYFAVGIYRLIMVLDGNVNGFVYTPLWDWWIEKAFGSHHQ